MLDFAWVIQSARALSPPPKGGGSGWDLSLLGHPCLFLSAPEGDGTFALPVSIISPLVYAAFARELGLYPDAKKQAVLHGIRYGFRIGFDADLVQLQTK